MSTSLSTSKQPLTFMPVDVASRAGASSSGWSRLGSRPWAGHVTKQDGSELAIEEVAAGWNVTDASGKTVGGRDLEQLLKRVLK